MHLPAADSSGEYDDEEILTLLASFSIQDLEGTSVLALVPRLTSPPPPVPPRPPHSPRRTSALAPVPRLAPTPPPPPVPPRPPRLTSTTTPLPPSTPPTVPRTPPRPPPYSPRQTPGTPSHTRAQNNHPSPSTSSSIYRFHSPSQSGYTREWYIAGAATQGVPGAHVQIAQHGTPRRKTAKAAFVIFCGTVEGVFLTWREVEPLVSGVRNCIFRGYSSFAAAHAAFTYAQQRGWTRSTTSTVVTPIDVLPDPESSAELDNPLHGDESLDPRWFIVYRGITPGVYRSHLECQLNTLGVRGSLHESITGTRAEAVAKFEAATNLVTICSVPPTYHPDSASVDPFL
ncbi:hypothetical protein C8R43DRAFT_1137627 [Mycena crocata]|nr:hypothetical protein C8R43DRAFT_1137627 [Mycena crocata]